MLKIKKSQKKIFVITGLIAILIISGGTFLYSRNNSSIEPSTPSEQQDFINLDPPTEEDALQVEENKQKIADDEDGQGSQPSPQPGTKIAVKPVITYAQQYGQSVEVAAEVATFEAEGTCTATFSLGATSFTKTVQAVQNVNRMNCPVMIAASSEFNPKGTWSVSVAYNSATASGVSDTSSVSVE